MARASKFDWDHVKAAEARARVLDMIDILPAEDLVKLVKEKPSLRGMVLGNIAELLFERHVPTMYPIKPDQISGHDDHDRSENKSDRTITLNNRKYAIQIKSIQTGSIKIEKESGRLIAAVQNDGSDCRTVRFSDDSAVVTTCYVKGQYDILAVPLYPFTGENSFAYKRNEDCRLTTSKKYTLFQRQWLLATTENICWPLSEDWSTNLLLFVNEDAGSPINDPDVIAEPSGEIRIREAGAVILPDEN